MGTVLASKIISDALVQLGDIAQTRWTNAELLGYLNSGQREACVLKPDIYVITTGYLMQAGSKQVVPPAGFLVDVVRNLGPSGTAPGESISMITKDMMDSVIPGWHSSTASGTAQYAMYDIKNPGVFYLYPPQPSPAHYIELSHAGVPPTILITDPITLADIYENILFDYVMFKAKSKQASSGDPALAQQHYASFVRSLGGKMVAEKQNKKKDASNETAG